MAKETNIMQQESMEFWRKFVMDNRKNFIGMSMATVVFDQKKTVAKDIEIWALDHVDIKVYRLQYEDLMAVRNGLSMLAKQGVHVREGFYDKSLNTEIFAPIERFTYTVFNLECTYPEIVNLCDKINEAHDQFLIAKSKRNDTDK